jgi:DnaJ-class molecular chaperone
MVQVLIDSDKRRIYDQQGEEGLKKQHTGGGGGFNPFDMFFGGRQQNRGPDRGPDIQLDLYTTLEDLYMGNSVEIGIKSMMLCPNCRGF